MDVNEEKVFESMKMPRKPIHFTPATAGERIQLGPNLYCRVMEDGSNTDNRIGAMEFTIPANTSGPPAHWHEMHDETFLVTKGTLRFHAPDGKTIDAKAGDFVVVPTRAPHTFSNPTGEDAMMFNTFTPAYYVNYFKLMSEMMTDGQRLKPEQVMECMARFATVPAKEMMAQMK
ncbi:RmlC-like cupin domain-containing protein [Xylariaceae sp. FL0255]|nr:RmlC-like cupin domain-containing protein [Xylariaceae sp. FL0255]